MKIVATSIKKPLEDRAIKLYNAEFQNKDESGIVVFPEGSFEGFFDDEDYEQLGELVNYDNVIIVGSLKGAEYQHSITGSLKSYEHQQSIMIKKGIITPAQISYPNDILPGTDMTKQLNNLYQQFATDKNIKTFLIGDELHKLNPTDNKHNTLIRLCSDVIIPHFGVEKSDLLLVPSAITHWTEFFNKYLDNIKQSLKPDAKIVYSPIKTNYVHKGAGKKKESMPFGIYDLELNQVGEIKKDYSVLSVK